MAIERGAVLQDETKCKDAVLKGGKGESKTGGKGGRVAGDRVANASKGKGGGTGGKEGAVAGAAAMKGKAAGDAKRESASAADAGAISTKGKGQWKGKPGKSAAATKSTLDEQATAAHGKWRWTSGIWTPAHSRTSLARSFVPRVVGPGLSSAFSTGRRAARSSPAPVMAGD